MLVVLPPGDNDTFPHPTKTSLSGAALPSPSPISITNVLPPFLLPRVVALQSAVVRLSVLATGRVCRRSSLPSLPRSSLPSLRTIPNPNDSRLSAHSGGAARIGGERRVPSKARGERRVPSKASGGAPEDGESYLKSQEYEGNQEFVSNPYHVILLLFTLFSYRQLFIYVLKQRRCPFRPFLFPKEDGGYVCLGDCLFRVRCQSRWSWVPHLEHDGLLW